MRRTRSPLLCARRERPRRRAAERNDELAPSKANAHLALLCLREKNSTGEPVVPRGQPKGSPLEGSQEPHPWAKWPGGHPGNRAHGSPTGFRPAVVNTVGN
jgi:hypothetical protein